MVTDSAARASQKPINTVVYVDVALPVPLAGTFTYRLRQSPGVPINPGSRVLVPFGKRRLTGYCVATHEKLEPESGLVDSKIRDIIEVVDEEPLLTREILDLTQWAAGYYASSWGEMLKGSLPAGINSQITPVLTINPALTSEKSEYPAKYAMIAEHICASGGATREEVFAVFGERNSTSVLSEMLDAGILARSYRIEEGKTRVLTRKAAMLAVPEPEPGNESQRRVVECLKNFPEGLLVAELRNRAGVSDSPLKTLEKNGIIKIVDREIERDPFAGFAEGKRGEHELTGDQAESLKQITKAVDGGVYKAFLLRGVTGSGKTEVYIQAMKRVLEKGRSALMLVPEIALTPVFSRQLRSVFGKKVAILHSSLSTGERFDEWRRIRRGEARVVIGTRSAVFAPLEKLGLIVVDEEHDTSYRQHEMPFYHGRDIAIVRASKSNAVVVLGSATPALESFRNAETGKYEKLVLPNRISGRPLAKAELIDMREAGSSEGKKTVLSNQLCDAITDTHRTGEQSMILLNRRGFSQFVLCRSCGESVRCRNCEITLTFHRKDQKLICHYCNYRIGTPDSCPDCESRFLYFLGEGTEQVEELLRQRFPELRIARVDRDTTRKKRELERILESFGKHELDMLIGTQMIAKGHDFPNVTLVGVVSVDAGLAMPDFRSAERTFQLLTQAAGRAGRGEIDGRVMIQTFHPDHYAIGHAVTQDFRAFYEHEIEFRKRLNYPPFVAMGQILFKHRLFDKAFRNSKIMEQALRNCDKQGRCIVLGPAPAPLSRLKGEYRVQILVKSRNRRHLRETVEIGAAEAEAAGCEMRTASIEIDPVNLL